MKPSSTLKTALAALCALGFVTAAKADYTTDLLAQWTFNSGTAADLTSDIGGFTFAVNQFGNTPTYNAGSIFIDSYTELVATGINSTAQPNLASTATVWVNMQFNSAPTADPVFFFGLENATAPADWNDTSMAAMYANWGGANRIGQYSHTTAGAYGNTLAPPIALNTSFTMALVLTSGFDENGNVNAGLTRFETYLNGVSIGSGSAAGTTVDSLAFALGTLKAAGGADLTFDEARVYDAALTGSQISQLAAAPVPEPSVLALLGGGILLVTMQAWRRNRRGQHRA